MIICPAGKVSHIAHVMGRDQLTERNVIQHTLIRGDFARKVPLTAVAVIERANNKQCIASNRRDHGCVRCTLTPGPAIAHVRGHAQHGTREGVRR